MAYDPEYYKKKALEGSQSYLNEQLGIINSTASKQTEMVNNLYKGQIADVDSQYADEERRNAVQKYINEQEVKETMANMGLTDSGLNRTQQTAVQLSAANNAAKLQRQKQNMVDSLTREMTAALADIETKRLSSESTLRQSVYDSTVATAEKARQADLDYEAEIEKKRLEEETKRIKEQAEQEAKISAIEYGTLAGTKNSSNNNVTYTDSSGRSITVRKGTNPYAANTSYAINKDIFDEDGNPTRVFSNGYQPDNVNGNPLKKYKAPSTKAPYSSIPTKVTVGWRSDGVEQQIWTDGNKNYLWYGPENRYVEARFDLASRSWQVLF